MTTRSIGMKRYRNTTMLALTDRHVEERCHKSSFKGHAFRNSAFGQTKKVLLVIVCCLTTRTQATSASTGFPGTLPPSHWGDEEVDVATGAPSDEGSVLGSPSSDDGEGELESSSDFEDVKLLTPAQRQGGGRSAVFQEDGEVESEGLDSNEEGEWSTGEDDGSSDMDKSDDDTLLASASTPIPRSTQGHAVSSQPLRTLEKLQQMLDETDYMTESPGIRHQAGPKVASTPVSPDSENPFLQPVSDSTITQPPPRAQARVSTSQPDRLWTSKDRMKYKKQQERLRRAKKEQIRLEQQIRLSPPVHPSSSDEDGEPSDTDDGLGYSLPNLPVYFSDTEGTTDMTDGDPSPTARDISPPHQEQQQPHPPFAQQGYYPYPQPQYSPYNTPPSDYGQQPPPPFIPHPPSGYPPFPQPFGPYSPQQQQILTSHYNQWAAASGVAPYGSISPPMIPPYQTHGHDPSQRRASAMQNALPRRVNTPSTPLVHRQTGEPGTITPDPATAALERQNSPSFSIVPGRQKRSMVTVEQSNQINFDSVQKLSILMVYVASLAYCAVSPRNLPLADYNLCFLKNLKLVALALIGPFINFSMVVDAHQNDINNAVTTFYTSFTVGYFLAFALELILTTLVRLVVFFWWEPEAFMLTPHVPALLLPWVLRENGYRPRRITLFAADFATSCVAAPVVEEFVKLRMLQLSVRLPRNFRWTARQSSKTGKRRRMSEAIEQRPGDSPVTNVNSYVTQMLAASMGLKLCDTFRRILMYTKARDADKDFFAICRGVFPIQELCGTMTALALAQRDVLGVDMPLWKMLLPAIVIHGMANFRGMKPIFKWNSATPWSEMQLSPLHTAGALTRPQLLKKSFPKLMWLIVLTRVAGYCIKNYYLIRRQAMKRTTTYAGKHSAFSAELAATEALKHTKD